MTADWAPFGQRLFLHSVTRRSTTHTVQEPGTSSSQGQPGLRSFDRRIGRHCCLSDAMENASKTWHRWTITLILNKARDIKLQYLPSFKMIRLVAYSRFFFVSHGFVMTLSRWLISKEWGAITFFRCVELINDNSLKFSENFSKTLTSIRLLKLKRTVSNRDELQTG